MSTSNTCTKVTVRQAKIKNGMISLYLDYYPAIRNPKTMRMTRREYLGITSMPIQRTRWRLISIRTCS